MYDYRPTDKKIEIQSEDNSTTIAIKDKKGLGYFIKLAGDKIREAYTTTLGRKEPCDPVSILREYNMESLLNYCPN